MARYFFHVLDGEVFLDLVGSDLPDVVGAKEAAIRCAIDILGDRAGASRWLRDWRLELTDEAGAGIFSVSFSVSERRERAIASTAGPVEPSIDGVSAPRRAVTRKTVEERFVAAVETMVRTRRSRRRIEKLVDVSMAAVSLSKDLLARVGPVEQFGPIRTDGGAAPASAPWTAHLT